VILVVDGWNECKLGDVADVLSGYAFKSKDFVEHGVPVIKIKNIIPPYISLNDIQYVSKELAKEKERYELRYNDILISLTGSNINQISSAVGKVGRIKFKQIKPMLNQRVGKFEIIDPKRYNLDFLYYIVSTAETRWKLASNAGGAANQANISPSNIKDLIIPIPPLPEQKDIASILSALDDKIELNNQMNKKLEQMTQAIFKSWFVDFEPFKDGEFEDSELGRIPKGWKIGRLGDSADITMGQSPAGSSFNEKGIGTIFYQGRTDFGFRFPKIRLYTTEPKRMASKGDILLSVRAPVGDLNIANNDCCLGRGVASIRSKSSCNSYIYYLLKNIKDSFDVYNGTIFGSINKDALNNIKVKIPTDFIIHKFQKVVNECDIKIENNSNQTQILTCIRDSLLTKLMSGEIRVPMED